MKKRRRTFRVEPVILHAILLPKEEMILVHPLSGAPPFVDDAVALPMACPCLNQQADRLQSRFGSPAFIRERWVWTALRLMYGIRPWLRTAHITINEAGAEVVFHD